MSVSRWLAERTSEEIAELFAYYNLQAEERAQALDKRRAAEAAAREANGQGKPTPKDRAAATKAALMATHESRVKRKQNLGGAAG